MLRTIAIVATIPLASCGSQGNQASNEQRVPATSTVAASVSEPGRRGRDGDTVMLFLHHVKADKRAEYERWFSEVWAPAIRAVADKRQSARRLVMAERDLRATEANEKGDHVYAYLYDPWVSDTGGPEGGFPASMLIEAGRSVEDAKKQADLYRSLVKEDEGFMFVQKQF